jgi:hypothetical protein
VKEHQTIDAFDQSGDAFQVGENLLLRNRVLVCQGGDLGGRVDHQRHRAPRGMHEEQLIVRAQRTRWQAEVPAEINDGHNPSLDIDHTEYNLRRGVRYRGDRHQTNDACHSEACHGVALLIQSRQHELTPLVHHCAAPGHPQVVDDRRRRVRWQMTRD